MSQQPPYPGPGGFPPAGGPGGYGPPPGGPGGYAPPPGGGPGYGPPPPGYQPGPGFAPPAPMDRGLVTTGFDFNDHKIVRYLGLVRGLTVRSRSVIGNIGAG